MASAKPNLVLLLLDTARADRFSCYGYPRETSPFLDKIAKEGIVWENAISSANWTLPAVTSIFSALFPSQHNADYARSQYAVCSRENLRTLPMILRANGYRTVGISNNGWYSNLTHLDEGFDLFDYSWTNAVTEGDAHGDELQYLRSRETLVDLMLGSANPPFWYHRLPAPLQDFLRKIRHGIHSASPRLVRGEVGSGSTSVSKAIRWLDGFLRSGSESSFFLFLSFMEPHANYHPPYPFNLKFCTEKDWYKAVKVNQDHDRFLAGDIVMSDEDFTLLGSLYDGEIAAMDCWIGRLIEALRKRGILDNTILVIVADHGESIGEHGLMGHELSLYNTLIHVPLIMRHPRLLAPGQRQTNLVQTTGILPTVLDLLDIKWTESRQIRGNSLLSSARGDSDRYAISRQARPFSVVRRLRSKYPEKDLSKYDRTLFSIISDDGWKYISASDTCDELYNLSDDRHEARNLILSRPERAAELRDRLVDWVGRAEQGQPTQTIYPTRSEQSYYTDEEHEVVLRRLHDLGYY